MNVEATPYALGGQKINSNSSISRITFCVENIYQQAMVAFAHRANIKKPERTLRLAGSDMEKIQSLR